MVDPSRLLAAYRALGADPPFGDPRRAHGVPMEGYFWRFSDARSGRVIVALCGLCRGDAGRSWAGVALAAHPGGLLSSADLPRAGADRGALGVWAEGTEGSLRADGHALRVDLGPQAQLAVRMAPGPAAPRWRPPAMLGGSGPAHLIPGLGQYWHPHLFGIVAEGTVSLGTETVDLTGFHVYAEKNWSPHRTGFPARWWWGQAQDFPRADVAVAFAGGELAVGPRRMEATGIVVAFGGRRIRLGNPLLAPARVRADGRTWTVHARGPLWSVELRGAAGAAPAHVLPVPDLAAERSLPTAHEHLAGSLALVLRRRGRVVWSGSSPLAGLEVGSSERR